MKQIYGIDLSKDKFDVSFCTTTQTEKHLVVKNNYKGISSFLSKVPITATIVAEHTGVYGDLLVFLSNQLGIRICLVSGYQIKHSFGLQRGKTDKIDSKRIREYGERFNDKLVEASNRTEEIEELQELYSLRKQLVKERKMLSCHAEKKSQAVFNSIKTNSITSQVLYSMDKAIKELEHEIMIIISSTTELNENYNLVTSVKGVGQVTACDLIIKTENFTKVKTAKKVASYAGICPFPNASGTMVKKSKTSSMSDKDLKTLLFLCAKSAVKNNKEYKLYYLKKQLEGKHHFTILNNVANKLLRTIFKIIETREPWDQNYICFDPRENINKITA